MASLTISQLQRYSWKLLHGIARQRFADSTAEVLRDQNSSELIQFILDNQND